jgi:3',5'-cyclic AMP phosphodiesterase CpdA
VGSIGAGQLKNLEPILDQAARKQLYRVLLIHHPPAPRIVSWRKRLTDAVNLHSLLDKYGADLILHGHAHRAIHNNLQTQKGNIPVIGAPSISALGRTPERRARYYIYRITAVNDSYEVILESRIYSPEKNCFIRESEQNLNDT